MKTILSIITAFILLSAIGISAALLPLTIDLQFTPAAMYLVKITNINTGVVSEQYTDSNGLLYVEWANIDDNARYSDSFKATIGGKDYPLTVGVDGIEGTISVSGVDCVPQIKEVIKEVPVEVIREVNVEVIKNVYVCSDGTTSDINDCQTVPTNDTNYAIIILVGVLTFIAGSGLKIYKKLDGSVAVQHKHKNVVGYHDPNIVHKVQPHKKGEIAPKYAEAKGTDGYYKYLG